MVPDFYRLFIPLFFLFCFFYVLHVLLLRIKRPGQIMYRIRWKMRWCIESDGGLNVSISVRGTFIQNYNHSTKMNMECYVEIHKNKKRIEVNVGAKGRWIEEYKNKGILRELERVAAVGLLSQEYVFLSLTRNWALFSSWLYWGFSTNYPHREPE